MLYRRPPERMSSRSECHPGLAHRNITSLFRRNRASAASLSGVLLSNYPHRSRRTQFHPPPTLKLLNSSPSLDLRAITLAEGDRKGMEREQIKSACRKAHRVAALLNLRLSAVKFLCPPVRLRVVVDRAQSCLVVPKKFLFFEIQPPAPPILTPCELCKTVFNPLTTCPSFRPVKAPKITWNESMN